MFVAHKMNKIKMNEAQKFEKNVVFILTNVRQHGLLLGKSIDCPMNSFRTVDYPLVLSFNLELRKPWRLPPGWL